MAADTIVYWNDLLHSTQTTRVVTASTTAPSFAAENIREADLVSAWKPNDSASTDEWVKADGATTGWLGAAGATAYFGLAYDARGSNQNLFRLQYGTTDDGAFAAPNDLVTHVPITNDIGIWIAPITIPGTAKRWIRILQKGTDRSGGNVTSMLLYWAMFSAPDRMSVQNDFPGDSESRYSVRQVHRTARMETAAEVPIMNQYAAVGQEFELALDPVSEAMWARIKSTLRANGGPMRAVFFQKEGLDNTALANVFLCQMVESMWQAERRFVGSYENVRIAFRTCPYV